jgi:hypothetical protein
VAPRGPYTPFPLTDLTGIHSWLCLAQLDSQALQLYRYVILCPTTSMTSTPQPWVSDVTRLTAVSHMESQT